MKRWCAIPVCLLLASTLATATDDLNHILTAGTGSGGVGTQTTVAVTYVNLGVDPVQGWSMGVCTGDPAVAQVASVEDGATTQVVACGSPPDFDQVGVYPGQGWTVGVVISFLGTCTLAPSFLDEELHVATYDLLGEGTTDLCFCDTLGTPPVATVIVVNGSSIDPVDECGSIDVLAPGGFEIVVGDVDVAPGSTFDVCVSLFDPEGGRDTQGFSIGLSNDPAVLTPVGFSIGGVLQDLNGGSGPDFIGENFFPDGFTLGCVYAFLGGQFVVFDTPQEVVCVTYEAIGGMAGDTTTIDCTDELGEPPVATVVVVAGASIGTTCTPGTVTFLSEPAFIRGDCNDDGIVNIADGVWALQELFYGGPASPCREACDANDDGMTGDVSDATYIFNYRFLDGPPPPSPFPDCGTAGADVDCLDSSCQ